MQCKQRLHASKPITGNIMKNAHPLPAMLISASVAIGAPAFAGSPPNIVSSDVNTADTAMGTNALYSNTTGDFTTAAGMYSLNANTTGRYNTAFGSWTMSANTVGGFNTA